MISNISYIRSNR